MADTIQQPNFTPSVAELLFVLFESTEVASYTQGERFPQIRDTLKDAVVRILGIHTKGVSRDAVCLDVNGPAPTLLVASDDPAFLNYVETMITLLRRFARANEGPDSLNVTRTAQRELITSVLRHSLSPHAREYSELRNRFQKDLDSGVDERFMEVRKGQENPDSDEEDLVYLETKCSRGDAEKWRDGLTYVLGVIQDAPDSDMARDIDNNNNADAVGKFWVWAKQRMNRRDGNSRVYAHVRGYPEPPSATDLLRFVDHVVQAIVLPITVFTASQKPDSSTLAWLHDLTIRRLENSPPSSQCSFESTSMPDPKGLEEWLFNLVYSPLHDARTSTDVLKRIISTEVDIVRTKWARYIAKASVHPEMTHLIELINNHLAVTVPENELKDHRRWTFPSLVACTGTSCPTCVLCYKATKAAYDIKSNALNLFPTEGEIGISPHPSSPCFVPPLPRAVEERLKIMLTREIKTLVRRAIVRLSPKPEFGPSP